MAANSFASQSEMPVPTIMPKITAWNGNWMKHTARRRHALAHRSHEPLGPPVQQNSKREKDEVVGVQVERGQRTLGRCPKHIHQVTNQQRRHENVEQRTDTIISTAVVAMLCHKNSVRVSGINPLIANSDGGIDDLVAISIAADDDRPIAHTAPRPRYAAAPAAR